MSRIYSALMDGVSVAAVAELFFIAAPADATVRIHEIKVTQDSSTTSEQLPLNTFRTATDQSAKGTSITANPTSIGDAAFGGVVRSNILTAAGFATETTPLLRDSQNVLNGWHVLPTPETRIDVSPGAYLVVKLDAAPASALSISGYILFEEIGG